MHPELNIAIARANVAERLRAAEQTRRLGMTRSRVPSDLRTRFGHALVSLGTRLAAPRPGREPAGRRSGAATLTVVS
jgi:hypothetical protein